MTKRISDHAAAAKLIRAKLKQHSIKASVRSKSYAGGNSVDVNIEQDILPATKREIESFCNRFQMGHFDGMTDCYEYSNRSDDFPQVKFVFVRVNYSEEIIQAAKDYAGEAYWPALNGVWGDFWLGRKP